MATLLHPNGFIQHDLKDGARLHIWADDLPIAQKTRSPIHDHTYTFESRIVMGMLVQETFHVEPMFRMGGLWFYEKGRVTDGVSIPTHRVWYGDGNGLLAPTERVVRVNPNETVIMGIGATYEFGGPNNFHDTHGAEGELTATIMRKTKTNLGDAPQVLVPVDMEPDNDFRREQYGEELLMPWVTKVLAFLEARNA